MTDESSVVVRRIGRLLEKERKLRGLTLERAAKLVKLSPAHLKEVEKGFPATDPRTRRGPTLAKLERVAKAYGLRVGLVRR